MSAPAAAMSAKDRETVRTIIQALILGGVLWVGRSITTQSESIVKLQTQVDGLQLTLKDVPGLTSRVTTLEAAVKELNRRQDDDDRLHREQLAHEGGK